MEPVIRWYHRVLGQDAAPWLALGWHEAGIDHVPSVADTIVILEWDGEGEPPRPGQERAA